MSDSTKANFFVVIAPERGPGGRVKTNRPVKVVNMTRGKLPALASGEIAVAVELDIPWEAFQPHAVGLVVKPTRGVIAVEQPDLRETA